MENIDIINVLREQLEMDGYIYLTVHGNSMLPTLLDGQQVCVKKSNGYKLRDIVAYYIEDQNTKTHIIIHRIIFIRENYILAKGDHNSYVDPLRIPKERIMGIVSVI